MIEAPRVALVLGGGGNRGSAHAGVINVLARSGVPVDLLVGTSAGSLAAVFFADQPQDVESLAERAIKTSNEELVDFSLLHVWNDPVDGDRLQSYVRNHVQAQSFDELKIKVVAVTTDLTTSQAFPIGSGPIAPAINASCAVPGVFRPLKLYGHVLVDGGVVAAVPVSVAEKYRPEIIIAVDVSPNALNPDEKTSFAQHIADQKAAIKRADVLIKPDVGDFSALDDTHNQAMFSAGEAAAKKALPQIRALLMHRKIALLPQFRAR